jgi:hypothetical protein
MNEGPEVSIRSIGPSSSPPDRSERKSLWERLKPVWWLRGILAAGAIVGLADHLGLVRTDWLKIVHAIGARWNVGMTWVTDLVSMALPFDWSLTVGEGNILTLLSVLIVPAVVPTGRYLMAKERCDRSATYAVASFCTVLSFYVLMCLSSLDMVPQKVALWIIGGTAAVSGVIAIVLLAKFNPRYLKALVIILTFLLTLELFYLAPIAQAWMKPIVDAIDPAQLPTP